MSVFKKQELFWNNMFDAEDNMSYLPYVKTIKNTSNKYDYIYRPLSSDVSQKIKTMANGSNLAIYLILLTGVECLINKYTDEENIIVGFPTMQVGDKQGSLLNEFLILKNKLDQNSTFKSVFNRIKLSVKEAIENQKVPFKKMVRNLNLQYDSNNIPIINTMVSLNEIHKCNFDESIVSDTIFHFDLEKDLINLKLIYNENLYDRDFMNQIIEHLNRIFSVILYQYDIEINKVELLSEVEKNKLLVSFNDTTSYYPKEKTLHQLFEEQVDRTPEQLAIVFEDEQLTYCELNERANQLARTLRNQGVRANQLVGIMVERSIEMIVGILGILKAGGAYVPIDPEYPEDRINYMLKDSGVEILLSQQHLEIPFSYKGKILLLDDAHIYHEDTSNLGGINAENQLAYLIYTSGTTGKPKGVMVEHSSIHNTVQWKAKSYGFTKEDRVLMFSTFVFDSFITHFFGPIVSGSTVYILNDKQCVDPMDIKNAITLWQITHLQSTPNFLFKVLENMNLLDFRSIKNVVVGGEKITPMLIKKLKTLNPKVEICNEYGPTENSVISTMLSITNAEQKISIGKPISNVKIFILGKNNALQPINVPGEICISGDGIAKGYLNQPGLTAEKFVENPFSPGERMYRTGDLAKWLPDGSIEYIGRIDDQVKIRGYRIELGEVESALQKVELVRESIVVARENEDGLKQLCAYFVGDESLTVGQLREAMSQELPDYMIPSYFVQLAQMPLTPNGKIDRKALPEPEQNLQTGTEYVAPQTPIEEMLVSIWQTVLGVPQIGVLDNFFDLGGDSIKSIQVSSRLYQAGYRVDMKNLFKYSTVSSLSPHVEKITRVAEQGEVTGEAKLTPIQRWFFDREVTAPHHFNQAFMLYRKQGFDVSALRKTMQKIVEHHDALRMVFRQTEQGYEAWNRGIEEEELFSLEVMNLTGNGNPASAIEEAANVIQSSMHLSEGPLMKIALFQCEEGDHLLMVIHHLVVDGVSWRILLEDIGTGYEQAVNEEAIQLPQKTDSFQLWAEQLSLYANSSDMEKEREYWNEIEQIPTGLLPKDEEQDYGLIKDSEVITVQWTASETEQLLKQTNRAYNTEINDLLLTALGMAIHQWTGMENIAVNLEGHGRESILSDLDITRTVGWFTSQYPVVLPIEAGSNISHQIKNIKEGLRQIPHKGVGYGLLKYLSEHQEKQTFTLKPEISFNYLGQFDQDLENTEMQASPYSSGSDVSKYQARAYVLEINGMISDGRLSLGIGYNGKQYQRETIEQLANWLQASLQEVIEHCVTKERAELTPSDIIFKGMTIEALDRVVQETQHIGEIENVYPLTPMQKGMLFHSLLNSQSEAYFEQSTFDVQGNMNLKAFTQSLEQLVQRHAIFRTNFVSTGNDEPLQIVYRNRKIDFHYEDLHEMEEPLREEWVEKNTNKDRERGFNLAEDALMRMTILRTEEQTYRVIWSFHHILMDGWCMPLVIQEIFETYYATQQQREPELSVVTPYSDYIEWLEAQDHEEASKYWNEYLEGYEGQTLLPKENLKNEDEGYVLDELLCEFDRELTQKMKQVASDHQVTINSLIQTAWGALLQKYNGSQDVVFGSVVSGRPADIQGIENMIGLFINTIPVRIRCDAEESFVEVMKRNQKQAVASHAYDTHPLYEMQAQTEQKQDLITHLMVFENYPMETEMERVSNHSENLLEVKNANMEEQTSYNFNVIVVPGEEFKIRLNYNANVYDDASVERIRGHLIQVIKQVVNNPQICIQDLELVTAEEKMQIFEMFNDTATEYPCEKTIHQLFEEQVERTPDHVAVLFENQHLTYRELNERANQLARTLRGEGVQADQLVGIMVERSLEMIVGILGILKAGGAYVPIDPEYPEERIRYMLEDSGTKILLSQRHLQDKLSFTSKILFLDDEAIYHEDGSNLESKTGPNHLAYVIYTSGTTGNPKGILTTHRNIIRVVQDTNYISFSTQDKVLQLSSYAFDGSTFDIYGSLLNGSELILISKEVLLNMEKLTNYIVRENITVLFITTALFNVLVDVNINCLSNIRKVLFGGERVSVAHVRKAIQHIGENKIVHVYGPTESTVFATYYEVNEVEDKSENIPIGKPLSNTTTYIVNNNGHLQPIGVAGELWVGGSGLARSYLNRPELTSEKFVNNPFIPGERIYKTGDLVRWLSDGNIEYLGRIDQQVKIRGYRIELGEIEAQLLKIESVQEAIVVVRENDDGSKQLCAYFVANKDLTVRQIRETMSRELPDYMIPSYFVQLEQMPLTPNGKIDRKALPEPEKNLQTGTEYVAPQTPIEEMLVSIWQTVLGVPQIGVLDNFFDIGGDSIKAIQASSKLLQEGYKIEMKYWFKYQNIAELSLYVKPVTRLIDQKEVTGEVTLTPIQQWFFENKMEAPHHFNQAVMLYREQGFDVSALRKAMQKITEHHDALRMVFHQTEQGYEAWNRGIEEKELFSLEVMDFRGNVNPASAIEEAANAIQSSIHLSEGPLMKLGLFRCEEGEHLLIVIHHLVVDGVSWRILLEDIGAGYEQAVNGEAIQLPQKTDSFQLWAEQLSLYANNPDMEKEREYWNEVEQIPMELLPKDKEQDCGLIKDSEAIAVKWTKSETEQLLKQANNAYNTEINDLLLTALGMAVHQWTGMEKIAVNLEGHGRESILSDLDITRTVGWFTSQYPVVLPIEAGSDISQRIKNIKKGLRQIPNKGIGYGLLKYLSENQEKQTSTLESEISFNYLGQFDQDLEHSVMQISPYSKGDELNGHQRRQYALDINGMIIDGSLSMTLSYNRAQYFEETIQELAGLLRETLKEIIAHCVMKEQTDRMYYLGESELIESSDSKEAEEFTDKFFNSLYLKDVPGAIVVIVQDGKVLLSKGYGYSDVENKIPMNEHKTLMRVGSITKLFTSTIMMQLVEQGKINLYEDIQAYLGDIEIPREVNAPLTIEHLMSYTTGFDFPDQGLEQLINFDKSKPVTLKELIQQNMPTVVHTPGERYNYENFAFVLQGYMVEKITGVPFYQYAKEQLLKPLEMYNSSFIQTSELQNKLATGYDMEKRRISEYEYNPVDTSTGSMLSTGEDIAKFMIAMLQQGMYGENRILDPISVKKMLSLKSGSSPEVSYSSYGFETNFHPNYMGENIFAKSGNIPGFSSFMWLLPEVNTGAFVMCNKSVINNIEIYESFMNHYYPSIQNRKSLHLV